MDDILIATATVEGHVNLLKQVLERLQFHNLRVRKDKCKFLQSSIVYLGHTLSGAGLALDLDKVEDLKDMRPPTNVSEVHLFCGFVNYYASFLQGCSTVLQPLYNLTKIGVKFQWDESCQAAFQKLKTMPMSDTVLTHFDPTKRIKLPCDASAYGVGVVLSHIEQNGVEWPICYASRTMTKAEQNYSQLERESLSIIFGISKFHDYLWTSYTTVILE